MIQNHFGLLEAICPQFFTGKLDMAFIALNTDELNVEPTAPCGGPGVLHPTSPPTPKLHNCEAPFGEFDRTQRGRPLGHIGVPVSGNGNILNLPAPFLQHFRTEFRVDRDAEKIRHKFRPCCHRVGRMPADNVFYVDRAVELKKPVRERQIPRHRQNRDIGQT
jgi:hypothetical protein